MAQVDQRQKKMISKRKVPMMMQMTVIKRSQREVHPIRARNERRSRREYRDTAGIMGTKEGSTSPGKSVPCAVEEIEHQRSQDQEEHGDPYDVVFLEKIKHQFQLVFKVLFLFII